MSALANNHAAGRQAAGQKPAGIGVRAGSALAWWVGELRSIHRDAAHWLRASAPNTLTIEAGERRWVVRCKQNPIGEIDWGAADAASSRRLLRDLAALPRRPGAIVVEIPPSGSSAR